MFLILIVFCNHLYAQHDQQAASPTVKKMDSTFIYVGVLGKTYPLAWKNPSEYALEDGYLYKSTDYSLGEMNLLSTQDLSAFVGKIVVVHALLDKDLNKILVKKGKCPEDYGRKENMVQIRNDWVGAETGFDIGRSTRAKLKHVPFLRCCKIELFGGLKIKHNTKQKELKIIFRNTFKQPLNGLRMVAHYETMYAKPSPTYKTQPIPALLPQKVATFKVPIFISERRRAQLDSIIIEGQEGNLIFMIKSSF